MTMTLGLTAPSQKELSTASPTVVRVLPVLCALFESLGRAGVRYCHWKSNWRLPEALRGETDLDLSAHRANTSRCLAAELVLFVIRKSLDYAVASEALIPREWKAAADELRWLMSQGARDEDVRRLLDEYLPSVEFALFEKLRDAIESGRWGVGRFRLGRALASRLRPYRRFARPSATVARSRRAWRKAWRTLRGGTPTQALLSGGAVIGVVGSDGSGKSTVIAEMSRWL